jgi:YD repeat-containing protein
MNTAPLTRMFRAMAPGSRGGSWRLVAGFAAVCTVVQLMQPVSPAQAARAQAGTPAVSYTYDADGRLATVTDAAGDVATYHYDAVGNVTSITRTTAATRKQPAASRRAAVAAPRITAVNRISARVGEPITITGADFSPQRAADIVKIGSLMATVKSASRSELTVTAPPGSGGKVTVQTSGGFTTHGLVNIRGGPKPAPAQSRGFEPPPLHAAAGITALGGQIDTAQGAPLAGVTVTVSSGSANAVTNQKGQFLVSGLAPGHRVLTIDASALPGGKNYGTYTEPVELPADRTTVLPWISYLTPIDTAHAITIASPTTKPVTLTTPKIPGLKVFIPAGTVIKRSNGSVVTSLSITPLPADRTPMPWGPGMVPQYFTIQPGAATVSGPGLQVTYPNTTDRPPGETVSYLTENPTWPGTGWYRYGTGHVSANGKEIVPDAGTRYNSTGPGGDATNPPPGSGPAPGDNCGCGDPVDLSTGLFDDQATDISLPDIDGVTLTRDFRQLDDTVRDFGIGGSDSLNLYVVAASNGDYDLVQPDGGVVEYTPTDTTGVYQAVNTPTDYAGSTLTELTSDFDGPFTLVLRNGTQLAFGDPAYLTAVTDRYGNTVTINRDPSGTGQIQTVTTPSGRWLQFTYGICVPATSTDCVTQVADNDGRTVKYGYNSNGQLTSVTNVDGGVTKYAWASCTNATTCTELTSVTDPLGRVTKIAYSSVGLVTQETQPNGGIWKYQYTTSSGVITKVVVTDPDGDESSTSIGSNGYTTSNTVGYGT